MKMTPAVILIGVLTLLTGITLVMVYWPYAQQDTTPSEIFRPRTAKEAAGRKIYLQNGCVYCHSQSIRAFDWDGGSERIAQAGDYVADEPIQLGSQRTGVDLSHDGGEHPDDWQIAHFINPRYTRPSSIMPQFEWLGMERLKNRLFSMTDSGRLDHAAIVGKIVAGGLAERPFPLTSIRQNFSFDDQFRMGRHLAIDGRTAHHVHGASEQAARDRELVFVGRGDHRREQQDRMHSEGDGDIERFAFPLRLGGEGGNRRVGEMDAHPPLSFNL